MQRHVWFRYPVLRTLGNKELLLSKYIKMPSHVHSSWSNLVELKQAHEKAVGYGAGPCVSDKAVRSVRNSKWTRCPPRLPWE